MYYYLLFPIFVVVVVIYWWERFRNLYLITAHYRYFLENLERLYPTEDPLDPIKFYIGPETCYMLRSTEQIKYVHRNAPTLFNRFDTFVKPIRDVVGNNIITSSNEVWKNDYRPRYEQMFHANIKSLFVDTSNTIIQLCYEFRDQKIIDMSSFSYRVAGTSATSSFMGLDAKNISFEIIQHVIKIFDFISDRITGFLPRAPLWIPTKVNRELKQSRDMVYKFIEDSIVVCKDNNSFFSNIIRIHGMNNTQTIKEEMFSLMFTGIETTASSLNWASYYLAAYPEIQNKLRAEIQEYCPNGSLEYNDKNRMEYMNRFILEILRLHVPAPTNCTKAVNRSNIGGLSIEKGSLIFYSSYLNHRNPAMWKDPLRFNPDRFETEKKENVIPFSGGPFVCVGKDFAQQEIKIFLVHLLSQYKLSLISGSSDIEIGITIRPKTRTVIRLEAINS